MVKAEEIIRQDYNTIKEEETVSKALKLFDDSRNAVIVVGHKEEYKGVLCEKNILNSKIDGSRTKVGHIKGYAPRIKLQTDDIEIARLMVESGLSFLPVFDNEKIIGIVEAEDILKIAADTAFGDRKVRYMMKKNLITASPEDKISTIMKSMKMHNISRLPLMEQDRVVGIVTMHDIVRADMQREKQKLGHFMGEKTHMDNLPAVDVMNRNLVMGSRDSKIAEIVESMIREGVGSVMIMSDKKELKGLITRKDILKAILKS